MKEDLDAAAKGIIIMVIATPFVLATIDLIEWLLER